METPPQKTRNKNQTPTAPPSVFRVEKVYVDDVHDTRATGNKRRRVERDRGAYSHLFTKRRRLILSSPESSMSPEESDSFYEDRARARREREEEVEAEEGKTRLEVQMEAKTRKRKMEGLKNKQNVLDKLENEERFGTQKNAAEIGVDAKGHFQGQTSASGRAGIGFMEALADGGGGPASGLEARMRAAEDPDAPVPEKDGGGGLKGMDLMSMFKKATNQAK